MIAGSTPYSWTERTRSPGSNWSIDSVLRSRSTSPREVIISQTYKTGDGVQLLAPLAGIAPEPAYFVVARRRKACPLAPPQHAGGRFHLFTTELPERRIGDPRHRREHHRRNDGDFADDE